MTDFVKSNADAPEGFFRCEAAGLQWLSAAQSGVPCVPVVAVDSTSLTLRRLDSVPPSAAAATQFGGRLAATHDAGATGFGAGPDGWDGPGFFGPLTKPLPMPLEPEQLWGRFYADQRIAPMLELAAPRLSASARTDVESVAERCRAGDFDDDDPPARLHGDLWAGNVMWTADGAVLIDPAAHGGHRENDLAMLALFGCPFYDEIIDGYQRAHPLRSGWRERIGLHQLFALLAHVVLFGGGHAQRTGVCARAALAR